MSEELDISTEADWELRQLCDDEMCIGVLDENWQCRECGRVSSRARLDPRQRGMQDPEVSEAERQRRAAERQERSERTVKATAQDADPDWEGRQLCPDGTCVGVVVDGRCKVCGASPSP